MIPTAGKLLDKYVEDTSNISILERRNLKKTLEQIKSEYSNVLDRHEKAGYFALTGNEKRIYNRITNLQNNVGHVLDRAKLRE